MKKIDITTTILVFPERKLVPFANISYIEALDDHRCVVHLTDLSYFNVTARFEDLVKQLASIASGAIAMQPPDLSFQRQRPAPFSVQTPNSVAGKTP